MVLRVVAGLCQNSQQSPHHAQVTLFDRSRQRLFDFVIARNEGGIVPPHSFSDFVRRMRLPAQAALPAPMPVAVFRVLGKRDRRVVAQGAEGVREVGLRLQHPIEQRLDQSGVIAFPGEETQLRSHAREPVALKTRLETRNRFVRDPDSRRFILVQQRQQAFSQTGKIPLRDASLLAGRECRECPS